MKLGSKATMKLGFMKLAIIWKLQAKRYCIETSILRRCRNADETSQIFALASAASFSAFAPTPRCAVAKTSPRRRRSYLLATRRLDKVRGIALGLKIRNLSLKQRLLQYSKWKTTRISSCLTMAMLKGGLFSEKFDGRLAFKGRQLRWMHSFADFRSLKTRLQSRRRQRVELGFAVFWQRRRRDRGLRATATAQTFGKFWHRPWLGLTTWLCWARGLVPNSWELRGLP